MCQFLNKYIHILTFVVDFEFLLTPFLTINAVKLMLVYFLQLYAINQTKRLKLNYQHINRIKVHTLFYENTQFSLLFYKTT